MKNNSISKILVSVKTNGSRKAMALLLGFATLAYRRGRHELEVPELMTVHPPKVSWLTAVNASTKPERLHRRRVSLTAGGVWLATGSGDRMNGGVSPLYGSWQRLKQNRYSSRAYFFRF